MADRSSSLPLHGKTRCQISASAYTIIQPDEAGLQTNCYVRWKIFTLPNSLIVRVIGELADEDREALMIQARTIFIRA